MYRDSQSISSSIANRPGHIALVLVITISVLFNSICHAQIPFSHQIQIPTGNLSAPSILVDGDPDTGIFGDGAGGLGFTANNILGMFLNGNGNVGIGTNSPYSKLHVKPGTSSNLYVRHGSDFYGHTGVAIDSINDTNDGRLMLTLAGTPVVIPTGMSMGIGTTNPTSPTGFSPVLSISGTIPALVLNDASSLFSVGRG